MFQVVMLPSVVLRTGTVPTVALALWAVQSGAGPPYASIRSRPDDWRLSYPWW